MIFKVIEKNELKELFEVLSSENRTVGPVLTSHGKKGPVYGFDDIMDFTDMHIEYTTTRMSPKRFFLPYTEKIASFEISGNGWDKQVRLNADEPIVLFGLHPCDINALNKLDKVLLKSVYPMPHYAAKRQNMFIVGMDCMPGPSCFCRSMGTDTALHGFEMFLTDLGEKYFVEVLSNTAYNYLMQIECADPTENDLSLYRRQVEKKNASFTTQVDTTDLTKILDMEFQSHEWERWGEKCFSCGTCASVCPTCYCYGVEEKVTLDISRAFKKKRLHSCNLIDFARVTGGHNFRPKPHNRLKYRYYHKHRGFVEAYEESLCVGCGRCGDSCLGGITVPEVISSIRKEEHAGG